MNTPTTFTQDMIIWMRFMGIFVILERGFLTAKPCLSLPPTGSCGFKQSSYGIRHSVGKPSRWITLYTSFDSLVVTIASLLKFSVYFRCIFNTLPWILLLSLVLIRGPPGPRKTWAPGLTPAPPRWTARGRACFFKVPCPCGRPRPFPRRVPVITGGEKGGPVQGMSGDSPSPVTNA